MKHILSVLLGLFLVSNLFCQIGIGLFTPGTYGGNPSGAKMEVAINSSIAYPAVPAAAEFILILYAPTTALTGNEVFSVLESNVSGGTMVWDPNQTFSHNGKTYFVFNYSGTGYSLAAYGSGSFQRIVTIGITGGTGSTTFTIADTNSDVFTDFSVRSAINLLGVNQLNPVANPVSLANVSLPIHLTHFQAEAKDADALLTWQSESEHNLSHYDIERSTDQRNWQNIGKVDGKGDTHTSTNYQWTDAGALRNATGEYLYYRLKMVDTDAASEYSPIRSVRVLKPGKTVQVQPNPAANTLYIAYEQTEDTPLTISMYDNTGKLVLLTTHKTGMPVDVSALPRGVYSLQLTDRSTVVATERVVLQ